MKNCEKIKELVKNRLLQIRKTKNLSVDEFSFILDIPKRTIKSYEQKERFPSINLIINLHKKLNLNINWFISGEGSMFINHIETDLRELICQEYNLSEKDSKLIKNILEFLDQNNSNTTY